MLGPTDLVFCSGTLLSGGIPEMVEAAVAGNYQGMTLWPQDVQRAHADGLSDADICSLLADHGLVVADLDPLLGWTAQAMPAPGEALFELAEEREFYAIAEALGGRSVNVAQGFNAELDLDRAAEDLAGVCDRAAEHGLFITIEFLPWSGIPDVTTAWDLARRTGRENATVMVDAWHWFRGGADLDALRALPAEMIGNTQLNDAPAEAWDDLVDESVQARLAPGEGAIPVVDVIRALDEAGSRAPIGVEVFNARHASMSPAEVGRYTAEATRKVLSQARGQE